MTTLKEHNMQNPPTKTTLDQFHLPVKAYTSQEWFNQEQETIFSQTWQFAGLIADVSEPGSYICAHAGLYPLIVVHGEDGELRAFHNICRHRGTELLRTTGKRKKVISCPYHHWTYSLEGQLLSIPEKRTQFAHVDMSELNLHKAAIATWKGMIFVHPEEDAEPFSDYITGIEDKIGPHQPEKLIEYEGTRLRYDIKANWKIFAENYMDGYHLAHLHKDTLADYDHKRQKSEYNGRHWTFFQPLSVFYQKNLAKQSELPIIDHIPEDQMGAYVSLLFPNVGITAVESIWSVIHIIPVAPDRTIIDIRTLTMPMSTTQYLASWFKPSRGPKANTHADDPLESGDVMTEDIYACEQQQSAMKSPKFAIGPLSKDLEQSILDFHGHILDAVLFSQES